MFRHPHAAPTAPSPLLSMSQIIATDAPLLSPTSTDLNSSHAAAHSHSSHPYFADSRFGFDMYGNFAQGGSTSAALKTRMSVDQGYASDASSSAGTGATPLCVPTAQVFELALSSACPSDASSPAPSLDDGPTLSGLDCAIAFDSPLSASTPGQQAQQLQRKRSLSPGPDGPTQPKKPRERVSTKDFVPPDVTGLSKREARLVKNRAAAFLSRQRKREEFEQMEVRVAELERENAILRAGSSSSTPAPQPVTPAPVPAAANTAERDALRAELAQLRAQLATAEQRTTELVAQLTRAHTPAEGTAVVKLEPADHRIPTARGRSVSLSAAQTTGAAAAQKPERSAASLGLMVLLCALPSLLAMPSTQSALPTRFNLQHASSIYSHRSAGPHSHSLSALDPLALIPGELDFGYDDDWPPRAAASAGMGGMDIDMDMGSARAASAFLSQPSSSASARAEAKKGTLAFADGEALGLGSLDIAFDAQPVGDGRIRVRIHSPPAFGATNDEEDTDTTLTKAWPQEDPFLGVGAMPGAYGYHGSEEDAMFDLGDLHSLSAGLGLGSGVAGTGLGASAVGAQEHQGRKRVRIAMKSAPTAGGEGGEWEVEVC